MNETSEKVAKILLDINAITLNPKKPFKYASGILSPVYTDCRILMSFPKEREVIRDLLIDTIESTQIKFDVIAGTATAGIPHAAWVSEKMNLPMIYVRGKPKDHGKGNQIEGLIHSGQKAGVIEDLISTGESSAETVRAIRQAGGNCSHVFSIFNYGMKKSSNVFSENNITLYSLTTFETVVKIAQQNGSITKEEQNIILDWITDPQGWGKRNGFE